MSAPHPFRLGFQSLLASSFALLPGRREPLLLLAGAFLFLPMMALLLFLPPPILAGEDAAMIKQVTDYAQKASPAMLAMTLPMAFGHAAILSLLLGTGNGTVGGHLAQAGRLIAGFLALVLLIRIMVGVGMQLFILPGLFAYVATFLAKPAMMAEGILNPFKALPRGFALLQGRVGRIALLLASGFFVAGLGAIVILMLVSGFFVLVTPEPVFGFLSVALSALAITALLVFETLLAAGLYAALSPGTSKGI